MRLVILLKLLFSIFIFYVMTAGTIFLIASVYIPLNDHGFLEQGLNTLLEGKNNVQSTFILYSWFIATLFIILLLPIKFGLGCAKTMWNNKTEITELKKEVNSVLEKLVGLIGKKQD